MKLCDSKNCIDGQVETHAYYYETGETIQTFVDPCPACKRIKNSREENRGRLDRVEEE